AGRACQPAGHPSRAGRQRRDGGRLAGEGRRPRRDAGNVVVRASSPLARPNGRPLELCRPQGRKRGHAEEEQRGTFWRGITLETDTRLRVGRAIGKDEASVALALMQQLHQRGHPDMPPPLATDGHGHYREALVATWGAVPPPAGKRGTRPKLPRPPVGTQYLQVIKDRSGGRLLGVRTKVIYGETEEVVATVGASTAYVERTQLTSRQMNGRLVRKTL